MGILPFFGNAQYATDENLFKPKDPIVTMLDSLVALRNVIRLSEIDMLSNDNIDENAANLSDEFIQTRISKISTPIPLTFNKQVKDYITMYAAKRPQLTSRVLGLSRLYFPIFEQTLDKYNLPIEFKYLSIVESALNPTAVSPMGATGIWQFMYNTGKMYNLTINSYIDDRRDVQLATDAACRYFKDMYAIYGDWLLVVASYNCGPGNVNRAIARAGGSKNFWEISKFLPAETRGYVPAFIAISYVMNYAKEYKITPVTPAFTFFNVDTIGVKNKLTFRQLSDMLNIPYDVISFLNPTYKKGVIPGEGYKLYLPAEKIALYLANEDNIYARSGKDLEPSSFAISEPDVNYVQVKKYVAVKKGESLFAFANRHDCSAALIKKWNKLKSNHVSAGQKLLVLVTVPQKTAKTSTALLPSKVKQDSVKAADSCLVQAQKDSSTDRENVALTTDSHENQSMEVGGAANGAAKYIYHLVQPGDTLWNIARRYDGVTVEVLKEVNNFTPKSTLKVGDKIKVPSNS
jgi:membrane-bound lytic murein transglycosylase D